MMDFVLVEVDFDDPTTNVRGRRALLTTPEHDQPDREGLFPAGKQRTSKKLRLQSRYCEYKMKSLLIKVGFYDAFVWSLNTNEVCEVAAMANF